MTFVINEGRQNGGEDVLFSMVDVLLPFGGHVLVLINASFDESIGTVKGRRLLCVAGYLIPDGNTRRLSRKWDRHILERHSLPYFRMSACAHGNSPFDKLPKDDCIDAATTAISCIKEFSLFGTAVTIDLDEFEELVPNHPLIGSAYSFCVHCIIGGVQLWAERTNYSGSIAYFFEAGHESQAEANRIMHHVFTVPELRSAACYAGHAFVEKTHSPAVQAADVLAWQWYTDRRRELEGKPRRKDCEILLGHPHRAIHVGADRLKQLQKMETPPEGAERFLNRLYQGDIQ